MLFSYTFVSHGIEKLHGFIDWTFNEVWMKAPDLGNFGLALFDGNPELKELMTTFNYDDTKGGDFFYTHIELIYGCFQQLNQLQIEKLQRWYSGNNDIKSICANAPEVELADYSDLQQLDDNLAMHLDSFFKGLYSDDLLGLKAIRDATGDIKDHYRSLMLSQSVKEICPFCGINSLKGANHTKREAYDHYLPKWKYPFNSINFFNLAPACNECNSSYKTSKDPAHTQNGDRRKAFYPYEDTDSTIKLKVELGHAIIDELAPEDIALTFESPNREEEIETWKEVYGIEERYRAKCCPDGDGKYWYLAVVDEWKEDGRSPDSYLKTLNRHASRNPFKESNFLKKAFLDGCNDKGLFGTVTQSTAPDQNPD